MTSVLTMKARIPTCSRVLGRDIGSEHTARTPCACLHCPISQGAGGWPRGLRLDLVERDLRAFGHADREMGEGGEGIGRAGGLNGAASMACGT
jgi:hypothetical protein